MNKVEELIYFAGFFDGEGCISLTRSKRQGQWMLRISVANTVEEVLWLFLKRYGGRVVQTYPTDQKHKKCFKWTCSARGRKRFLEDLFPYLIVKKERAKIAFSFLRTVQKRFSGRALGVDVVRQRNGLTMQMNLLNH